MAARPRRIGGVHEWKRTNRVWNFQDRQAAAAAEIEAKRDWPDCWVNAAEVIGRGG